MDPVRDDRANLIDGIFKDKKGNEARMKRMNDVNYGRLGRPISNGVKKDSRRTLILFGLGLLITALGFLYLWKGSLTAAPILIIGGYLVMIISLVPFESEEK